MVPVSGGLLAFSVAIHDDELTVIAMGLVLMSVLVVVLQWLVAAKAACPLCLTPILSKKECAKHRHARSFLGSHRLRVALAVLFKNSFRCPYCHEPTILEVRDRSHYQSYSRD